MVWFCFSSQTLDNNAEQNGNFISTELLKDTDNNINNVETILLNCDEILPEINQNNTITLINNAIIEVENSNVDVESVTRGKIILVNMGIRKVHALIN